MTDSTKALKLGSSPDSDGKYTSFLVWAPLSKRVQVLIETTAGRKKIEMEQFDKGYRFVETEAGVGAKYQYLLDDEKKRPDPASRSQPDGVHGCSEVIDPSRFKWTDGDWKGMPLEELVIYELHIGTFTSDGTFGSALDRFSYLKDELGVTAIEIMPVAQFPGSRNWGYDGVDLFAPQNTYGGPEGLRKLVDKAHSRGLAVILDVVYNHLGPEGNYLGDFGPYFSYKYGTPWGPAVNYDESGSDEVRRFVLESVTHWLSEYHIDGLRLDAIDKIFDISPKNILVEISETAHRIGESESRIINVIAESDLNDPKVVKSKAAGGFEADAQWSDDFHHSVHSFLTGERLGYYADFGRAEDIVKSLKSAFVYDGKYSRYREKSHGAPTEQISGDKFVHCIQNHDQVGNRADGARLSTLISSEKIGLAAALLLLSQSIPLIFMGEEYGEKRPFYYFVDHSDEFLIRAVREGRKKEFQKRKWGIEFVDPQARSTFQRSKINPSQRRNRKNRLIFSYYKDLLRVRKSLPAFQNYHRTSQSIKLYERQKVIVMKRGSSQENKVLGIFSLNEKNVQIPDIFGEDRQSWTKIFDSMTFFGKSSGTRTDTIDSHSIELPPFSVKLYSKTEK